MTLIGFNLSICQICRFLNRWVKGYNKQMILHTKIACNQISCTLFVYLSSFYNYLTSSKSTFIHYQCVSTGCCVHVARVKISIDNQYVTKPIQKYDILPEQPKEKA